MLKKIKLIPKNAFIFSGIYFLFQSIMYWLGPFLSKVFNITNHILKIDAIDDKIPFIPVFIIIYVFSYIFWFFSHAIVCITSKKNFINYVIGLSLAFLIGFVIFVIFPTYMNRVDEGLILYSNGNNVFSKLYKFVYIFDGNERAINLFPSYHCLVSLYCYLGVRKQKKISKVYKVYSFIMTILICLSTLFTKQHYIIDVMGGILLSLLCYIIVDKLNITEKITNKYKW